MFLSFFRRRRRRVVSGVAASRWRILVVVGVVAVLEEVEYGRAAGGILGKASDSGETHSVEKK